MKITKKRNRLRQAANGMGGGCSELQLDYIKGNANFGDGTIKEWIENLKKRNSYS